MIADESAPASLHVTAARWSRAMKNQDSERTAAVAGGHPVAKCTKANGTRAGPRGGLSQSGLAVVPRVGVLEGERLQQLRDDGVDGLAELKGEGSAEEGRVDGEIVLLALQLHVGHLLNLPVPRWDTLRSGEANYSMLGELAWDRAANGRSKLTPVFTLAFLSTVL